MEPAKQPDDSGDIVSPSAPETRNEDNSAVPEELQPVDENSVEEDGKESGGISTPSSVILMTDGPLDLDGKFLMLVESASGQEVIAIFNPDDYPLPTGISTVDPNVRRQTEDLIRRGGSDSPEVDQAVLNWIASQALRELPVLRTEEAREEIKDEELLALAPNNKRGV
ncbi:uncharacterized protein TNCV_2570301 [Trichonephila clavipes]|nr:uncharacterized protein TNCV_2570301 [Trichonephila clavipes]